MHSSISVARFRQSNITHIVKLKQVLESKKSNKVENKVFTECFLLEKN